MGQHDGEAFKTRIEQSSLGASGARRLRSRASATDLERVRNVRDQVEEDRRGTPPPGPAGLGPARPMWRVVVNRPSDLDIAGAVAEINGLATPGEVAEYLQRRSAELTVPVLKEIARALGPTVNSTGRTKAQLRRDIVEGTAGFRVRSGAMSGGAWAKPLPADDCAEHVEGRLGATPTPAPVRTPRTLAAAGDLLRALAAPVRIAIVLQLLESDRSVRDFVDALGIAQPLISQHLRVLKAAGVVHSERRGREVVYSLRPEADHDSKKRGRPRGASTAQVSERTRAAIRSACCGRRGVRRGVVRSRGRA